MYPRTDRKLWAGLGISFLLLGLLIYDILQGGFISQRNLPIYKRLTQFHHPYLDLFFQTEENSNFHIITIFWVTVSIWFLWRKDIWRAIHWIGLGLFAIGFTELLKHNLPIPRPKLSHLHDSFPSAHVAAHATLLAGFILLLDLKRGIIDLRQGISRNTQNRILYTLYSIWISLIAFSRIYNGAHWLTDILGACLVSVISMLSFMLSYYSKPVPLLKKRSNLIWIGLGSLIIATLILHGSFQASGFYGGFNLQGFKKLNAKYYSFYLKH